MNNFDFHNLLFPTEFESFCRDILEIREVNIKFTTYRRGRDGGIDIKSTNTKEKIIGQCKLYSPKNEKELLRSLKKEIINCKRQKPDRYIICTNINLSALLAEEILRLFEGYVLNEEDIIDGIKLNKYLEKPEYEYIFKVYSKLLAPNLIAVESALNKIVNRKYYNSSRTFLRDIIDRKKLFHSTEQLPYLIQKIEHDKVIILSGNPGVGKTTMAKMIANYFISRKRSEVFYLGENDYTEILSLEIENKLIIVDDFWGQNFSPKIKAHSTYQREFVSLINSFKTAENCYLILVSRDYILKDVLQDAELDTETSLIRTRYLINVEEYSIEDKLRIFLNHLVYYDYELTYINNIIYKKDFEYTLNHKNYSPRLLEMFIIQYKKEENQNYYNFYNKLNKYLDNPTDYWKQAFKKLSPTAQLILLVLLTASDPLDIQDLKKSFNSIQEHARQNLNLQILPLEFNLELPKLEQLYISIENDNYYNTILIKFQSPGIKDYLLDYLRTDGYFWIKSIIKNALFFNQLTFVFSTQSEKINDYESDIFLSGEKIILDDLLKKELKHKMLSEFETLQFSNYEEREFSDQLSKFHSAKDTEYLKLLTLSDLFDIGILENNDIKQFILNKILMNFKSFESNGSKVVSHRSMVYFPSIVKKVFPYLNISEKKILNIFSQSITFASEYDYFYDFKEIFPEEFKNFYKSNIFEIRQHIKDLALDDIDYYLWENDEEKLDIFTSYTLGELSKKYKFRITAKYVKELEFTFGMKFPFLIKENKKSKKKSEKKNIPLKKMDRFKPKPYQSIIEEYLPTDNVNYNPTSYLKEKKYTKLIKSLKAKNCILKAFIDNATLFESVCEFIISENIQFESLMTFEFLDAYVLHFIKERNIPIDILTNLICELNNHLEQSNHYSLTQTKLKSVINASFNSDVDIDILSPIIIHYHQWYKLSSDIFGKYFLTKKASDLNDSDLYKEKIIDSLMENIQDIQILDFLQSANGEKLHHGFIDPELSRLMENIDFTNEKSITLSFVNFFQPEFDFRWNKKEKNLESYSSSNSESHYENILEFVGIDFLVSDFESYFDTGTHTEDIKKRLFINHKAQKNLYSVIIKTIPAKTVNSLLTNEPQIIFGINLSDFLTSSHNFQLLENAGLVYFTNQIVQKVAEYAQTANNILSKAGLSSLTLQ